MKIRVLINCLNGKNLKLFKTIPYQKSKYIFKKEFFLSENKHFKNIQKSLFRIQLDNDFNLFTLTGPGLYEIYCKANGKRYIGESLRLLDRLGTHTYELEKGQNSCLDLQKDWTNYGSALFEANILHIGPEFLPKEIRLKKEEEIIFSYLPSQVYNVHPEATKPLNKNYRIICKINGKIYQSISEASRKTKESETRIRNKLYRNETGYEIIQKVECGSLSVLMVNSLIL
jgi:hypothetical protein